jgi:predicted AAA+ superfamily ATPase
MKRTAYNNLVDWKNKKNRKPLIIKGARQVGKTWLMKEFGKNQYKNVIYINFEDKKQLQELFVNDFNIERILLALSVETGIDAEPKNTLIIFDEIQEAKRGITSLKYFSEEAPQYHIIAAGSYLGISLNKDSFPVGKVEFLYLEPLSFNEFLLATNQNKLLKLIENADWELIKVFKTKFIEFLKQYYFIGGMPEAVNNFIENNNFEEVREIQKNILLSYEHDFAKHAPIQIVPRILMVWNSIPAQLSKENKKFIFGIVKKGSRAKDYEIAMQWLIDSGLITKIYRVIKPSLPLNTYVDSGAFKVFLLDVGLLGAMSNLSASAIIDGNKIFEEFKGALTEQYVFQQLNKTDLFYWSAEKSKGEIDFIIQTKDKIIPIEVKAEENLKAKSLKYFCQKYKNNNAVRTSMSDYREEEWLVNMPLYAINNIN